MRDLRENGCGPGGRGPAPIKATVGTQAPGESKNLSASDDDANFFSKAASCGAEKGALGTMTTQRPARDGAGRTPDPRLTPQRHEELT